MDWRCLSLVLGRETAEEAVGVERQAETVRFAGRSHGALSRIKRRSRRAYLR
jgi:hypothetical protein